MNIILTFSIAAYNVEMYIEKLFNSIIDSGKGCFLLITKELIVVEIFNQVLGKVLC